MDNCFTWYGDDRYILVGHHSGRAALLHVEVGRLEKSPAETQRGRNVTGKFVTESLSHHCPQIQSVHISLHNLNSNGMGVGRNLIMKTPESMRSHTPGAESTLSGDPWEREVNSPTHSAQKHMMCDDFTRITWQANIRLMVEMRKHLGVYINSALPPFPTNKAFSVIYHPLYGVLNI